MADPTNQAWVNLALPSQGFFYKDSLGKDRLPGGLVSIRKLSFQETALLQSQGVDVIQRIATIIRNACKIPAPPDGATILMPDDLLLTDRMAILLNQRVISFGPRYAFGWRCVSCKQQAKFEINIQELKEITAKDVQDELNLAENPTELKEPFEVELKDAGKMVTCRFLRGKDETDIFREAKRRKLTSADPTDPSHVIRLSLQIVTIDGVEVEHREKERFVRLLTAADNLRIEHATEARETGIDTKVQPKCNACGYEQEMEMPFDVEFFRPTRL